jgi:hypothetical protein
MGFDLRLADLHTVSTWAPIQSAGQGAFVVDYESVGTAGGPCVCYTKSIISR